MQNILIIFPVFELYMCKNDLIACIIDYNKKRKTHHCVVVW